MSIELLVTICIGLACIVTGMIAYCLFSINPKDKDKDDINSI